jgi:transposase-like protein
VDLDAALALRKRGLSIAAAAKKLGVGRSTLHRVYQAHDAGQRGPRAIPQSAPPTASVVDQDPSTCGSRTAA